MATYPEATRQVANEKGVEFVDLFTLSQELYEGSEKPLTINGIHPNSLGNKLIAQHIVQKVFGLEVSKDDKKIESIRSAVLDKNWHWHNRYRASDGNDVWGGRSGLRFVDGQSNGDVLMLELDMIDVMVANRDKKVWAHAQGKANYKVDDSNVPPPVKVKTNVGGGSRSSNKQKEGNRIYMKAEDTAKQLVLAKGLKAEVFASEEMFPELSLIHI